MRLLTCRAINFMGLEDLEIELDRDMVVLLADNGVGKSSVLKAIRVALGAWMLGIEDPDVSTPQIERWMLRYTLQREGFELTKKYSGNATVTASARLSQLDSTISWSRSLKKRKGSRTDRKGAHGIRDAALLLSQSSQAPLPLIAYFGARRRVPPKIVPKTSGPRSRLAAYSGALDSSIHYAERFGRWRRLRDQAQTDSEAKEVYQALGCLLAKLLPGAESVEYNADFDEPVALFRHDASGGGIRAFSSLSDGFQNVLGIGLDLALRAVQLNPQLGAAAFTKVSGVAVIDEVDQHLHPSWQGSVASSLQDAFPGLQLIFATHSPAVALGTTPFAKILRLRSTAQGPTAVELPPEALGRTLDDTLMSEAFELSTTWSPRMLAATETRLELLKSERSTPKDPEILAQLEQNADLLRKNGHYPSQTEDLIRLVLDDLVGGPETVPPDRLQTLRTEIAERVRALKNR